MGGRYPDGTKKEITELPISLLLIWVVVGIFISPFLSFFVFSTGIFVSVIIYFTGIGLFVLLFLIFDRIELSSNKFLKWFCGFDNPTELENLNKRLSTNMGGD